MPLQGLILHVGGKQFVFRASVELTVGVRTGYILDGSGSTWTAIASTILGENSPFGDFGFRQGIFLDLGGGEHIIQMEAQGFEGSDLAFGGVAGADPLTQAGVLENAVVETQIDSFSPATIEFGEYSANGRFKPLSVVIEDPRITRDSRSAATFDVNMTFLEAASFDDAAFMDALSMTG